ncbi:MAG: response regulator transcription factor [Anaerolineaceae bacterium]|nr:response regulator transcription factor [Anaerolineaceae bacterium]
MLDSHSSKKSTGVDLDAMDRSQRDVILVIEDNEDTVFLLKQILTMAGFNVVSALNGNEGIKKVNEYAPDLILLDIMMPEMDGWETFQHLRRIGDQPVIIISAKESREEVVEGFRNGIDDYITKPFYNAEVIERIKAVLRRRPSEREVQNLVYPEAGLSVDFQNQQVTFENNSIRLTPREFSVFAVIAKQAPNLVGYSTIMQAVWDETSPDARKRMKYLVYLIRKKLDKIAPGVELLENVDRLGYRLRLHESTK